MGIQNVINIENFINNIKKVFTVVVICLLVFSFATVILANAQVTKSGNKYTIDTVTESGSSSKEEFNFEQTDAFKKIAATFTYYAYGGLFDGVADINNFKVKGYDDSDNGIWNFFWNAYESVSVVGVGLALIWTMLTLIETISAGHVNTEFVLRLSIQFLFCILIVTNGKELCIALISLGNSFVDLINDGNLGMSTSDNTSLINMFKEIQGGAWYTSLALILKAAIPALAMLACSVYVSYLLVARVFELGLRTIFAPIGAAEFFTHGLGSSGIRYLKRYLGCAARGGAMLAVVILSGRVSSNGALSDMLGSDNFIVTSVGDTLFPLVVAFITVGVMKQVDGYLNDVFS